MDGLLLEDVPLNAIADALGTPTYVYSAGTIRSRLAALTTALSGLDCQVHFAVKANDHIAVLRPPAWLMVGHCAGLRNSQSLGDFVLAHAYLREDHVLDADLPVWVPIPALAEIQIALQDAVQEVTQLEGYELKRIMRTGTVATIDNRNWELRHHCGAGLPVPGALRHAAVCFRQAAAWRVEVAGHGDRVLPDPGRAAFADRRAGDGAAARHAAGTHPQPQAAQL